MFWDIIAQNNGEYQTDSDGEKHPRWEYDIKLERKIIFGSFITGQYEDEPSLLDFLNDFSFNFNAAMLGFAKYGRQTNDISRS